VFSKYKFIGILHFAAKISVPESMKDPISFYRHNFCGTLNIVESAKQYNIQAIVFSSTCAVFGSISDQQAVRENTPPGELSSAYAQTKKDAEELLAWTYKAHNIPYACLRYFNVAGADPEGDLQAPKTYALLPALLLAMQHDKPFKLYGTDYDTKDGTCVRDYIHVSDLADAHVKGMNYLLKQKQPLTLCLGSGNGYTNLEVLRMVEHVSGKTVPYEALPKRPGDLESIYADFTKAKELLGWSPTLSLEDIVRTAMGR
jgi:UDP-glucose 4-epimerase